MRDALTPNPSPASRARGARCVILSRTASRSQPLHSFAKESVVTQTLAIVQTPATLLANPEGPGDQHRAIEITRGKWRSATQ